MSVLHDVLDKMMADFFSKEKAWNHVRDGGGPIPEPFRLTLDTPEFRQLRKELSESRLTFGHVGPRYAPIRNADDSLYEAEPMPDEQLRTYSSLSICYPYPANEHIYAARIAHNYTGAAAVYVDDVPERLSNPQATSFARRIQEFRTEDALLSRRNTPAPLRPGYRRGACNCINCRFEAVERERNRLAFLARQPPDIRDTSFTATVRAETCDGLRQQDRDGQIETNEWTYAFRGIGQWVSAPSPVPEGPPPAPTPAHPNDPRPRMPRLSDGRPRTSSPTAIPREIWSNRSRF